MTSPTNRRATPRIALVTGATAGLGAAFARALARRGYALVLVARDAERLAGAAASLRAGHGVEVEVIAADLATDGGVDAVLERIGEGANDAARAIALLVNNAGFGTKGSLVTSDPVAQETMLRLHVLAVHRLTQGAVRQMAAMGRGAVITVSSVASYLTSAGNVNYCATKGYQRLAMEALAREVAWRGIYVQALCPGFTRTEFHQRAEMSMRSIPGWMWLDADRVVADSLDAMERGSPTVVTPSARYKAAVLLLRFLPRWAVHLASGRYRETRQAPA
ncbi:MAG: SDR family NAD(P)-dependent oxidoreductase [Gemmatimonadaceae bacterium]|nr:SDR family NAD(P)-dependent oxidoreductase [Gemmatimonadaceae bacterium]